MKSKYTKEEKLIAINRFAQQFPSLQAAMQMLDSMREIHATMEANELFVSDEATSHFQSFCNEVMRNAAEWLESQAKAQSQTKLN